MATSHEQSSGNHQPAQSLATQSISSDQVYQGAILWLPRRENKFLPHVLIRQVNVERVAPNDWWSSTGKGIYAHPILVLSRPVKDPSRIDFVLLTSLGDTKGRRKDYDPRIHSRREIPMYLPIEPTEGPVGRDDVRLRYAFGRTTSTRGYVSFEAIYSMKWADAQPYADPASDGLPDETLPWVLEPMREAEKWARRAHERHGYRVPAQFWPSPVTSPSAVMPGNATDRPRSLIARVGERVVSRARDSWARRSNVMRHS